MKAVLDHQYQQVVARIGKGLSLGPRASEAAVIKHCVDQLDLFLKETGVIPANLGEVLVLCATRLNLCIREIHSAEDLKQLLTDFPPTTEPAMARIPGELTDEVDAIVLQRLNRKPWEQPYLAIINCMGEHIHRRYFSKWHEIVHLLLEGKQMAFEFRKTTESEKQLPLERLVDRVAAQLAFHPPMFKPILDGEIASSGRLTLDGINRVRATIVPEASWQATVYACIRQSNIPVAYARLGMGLKKEEAERAEIPDLFPSTVPAAEPKLRIKDFSISELGERRGLRMFKNMSVSDGTLAAQAFNDGGEVTGREKLSSWRGDAPAIDVIVEAVKHGDAVNCLLHPA